MSKFSFIILIALIFIFVFSLGAAETISEITKLQNGIKTMQADFVQEKHSELLEKPIVSKGIFYFSSPERFIWDYNEGIKVISDGTKLMVYYKELREADIIDITKFPSLPGSFSIEKLKERYYVEILKAKNKKHFLKLTPSVKSMPFREMLIILDEKGAPLEVKMTERTGDNTIIKFSNIRTNIALPEDFFGMEPPEGAKIRRH